MSSVINLRHYNLLQLIEMSEHRYYMGERLNRLVTDDEMARDWCDSGHAFRFRNVYEKHIDTVERFFYEHEVEGDLGELLTPRIVHSLLED